MIEFFLIAQINISPINIDINQNKPPPRPEDFCEMYPEDPFCTPPPPPKRPTF